jgi:glycosyltransferase involved in cell wall biosynthesis
MSLARRPLQKWDVATAQRVDFFIASSRYIGEKIKKYLGQESTIIHPPIDTEFFCPATGNHKEEGNDYYLVVSALVPYKRVDVAVEAFRGRRERLYIIGKGPEEKRLRKAAPENVTFLGWQRDEDLLRWYRNCRAVIFPQEEDFGIVPLEAMACGRPVIAFRGGGALETVTEGKTGVFFDTQTPESLSKALDAFRAEAFDPVELRSAALEYSGERFLAALRKFFKDKVGVTC